eukprot:scaffold28236_cov59-Phaeocystis_antarctica.AAC.11
MPLVVGCEAQGRLEQCRRRRLGWRPRKVHRENRTAVAPPARIACAVQAGAVIEVWPQLEQIAAPDYRLSCLV